MLVFLRSWRESRPAAQLWPCSHHESWNINRIFVDIQESIQGSTQGYMKLHLRGLDIKNVEPGLMGLGRSDPFFEISKKNSDHASGVVRWYVPIRLSASFIVPELY